MHNPHEFQIVLRGQTVEVEIGVYYPRFEGTFNEPPQEEHCEFEVFDMNNKKVFLTDEEFNSIHFKAVEHLRTSTKEKNYY